MNESDIVRVMQSEDGDRMKLYRLENHREYLYDLLKLTQGYIDVLHNGNSTLVNCKCRPGHFCKSCDANSHPNTATEAAQAEEGAEKAFVPPTKAVIGSFSETIKRIEADSGERLGKPPPPYIDVYPCEEMSTHQKALEDWDEAQRRDQKWRSKRDADRHQMNTQQYTQWLKTKGKESHVPLITPGPQHQLDAERYLEWLKKDTEKKLREGEELTKILQAGVCASVDRILKNDEKPEPKPTMSAIDAINKAKMEGKTIFFFSNGSHIAMGPTPSSSPTCDCGAHKVKDCTHTHWCATQK
jgi:hypothetical protein